jgi:hypothetical protein
LKKLTSAQKELLAENLTITKVYILTIDNNRQNHDGKGWDTIEKIYYK